MAGFCCNCADAASACFLALRRRKTQNPRAAIIAQPATGPMTAPAIHAWLLLSGSFVSGGSVDVEVEVTVDVGEEVVIEGPGVAVMASGVS